MNSLPTLPGFWSSTSEPGRTPIAIILM